MSHTPEEYGYFSRAGVLQSCRMCGCDDQHPCIIEQPHGGALACYWVEDDLCSACTGREEWLARMRLWAERFIWGAGGLALGIGLTLLLQAHPLF